MTPQNLISSIFLFALSLTLLLTYSQCSSGIGNKTTHGKGKGVLVDKQKGVHVFGTMDSISFQALKQNNIEWVTLVEWGYQEEYNSGTINHHFGDSSKVLQRNAYWLKQIKLVRAAGFKVFFKPHLWVRNADDGKWRSDIFPATETDWQLWQEDYRQFILRYAKIAEAANAEMFCIGTELTQLTTEKKLFWQNLIQEVRSVYSGKITYAANWYEEFETITFWEELDYIGIQAYFPLVENEYPTVKQISQGWSKFLPAMEAMHKKYHRPILFTEMGYKSTADSAIEPWTWLEHTPQEENRFSIETQANCYEAFFKTVWKKDWFAGVHIWQMRADYKGHRGRNDLDFTPQGKPAERIIAKGFE